MAHFLIVKTKRAGSTEKGYAICPDCEASVRPKNLERHRRERCPRRSSGQGSEPIADPLVRPQEGQQVPSNLESFQKQHPKRTYKPCPYCGQTLRSENLQSHMAERCSRRPMRATTTSKRNRGRRGQTTTAKSDATRLDAFRQNFDEPRDASTPYAHRYPEHGCFGSHPIHDDYSEESGPE
jgi:hypothetical protein